MEDETSPPRRDQKKRKNKKSSLKKKTKSKKRKREIEEEDAEEERKLIKKFHSYFTSRRLAKMKKLYNKFSEYGWQCTFEQQLNKVYGPREWSYLHEFCHAGEKDFVKFCLSRGSKMDILDKRGNNFLHCAFNYVIENFNRDLFYYLLNDVLCMTSQDLLTQRNDYGETPVDMLEEISELLQNRQKQFLETENESENGLNEKSWNERIFLEMVEDEGSCYRNERFAREEYEDTYRQKETFTEWGNRMWHEYKRKHAPKPPPERHIKPVQSGRKSKTKRVLGPANDLKELRNNFEMLQTREKYEEACFNLFKNPDKSVTTELRMDDIPWTHFPGYTGSDLDVNIFLESMIKLFSHGFTDEDKFQYFKMQRIRWHPDRFLQKCRHRLTCGGEREKILDLVKSVSQRINTQMSSFENV